jgi:hypothetical protein
MNQLAVIREDKAGNIMSVVTTFNVGSTLQNVGLPTGRYPGISTDEK